MTTQATIESALKAMGYLVSEFEGESAYVDDASEKITVDADDDLVLWLSQVNALWVEYAEAQCELAKMLSVPVSITYCADGPTTDAGFPGVKFSVPNGFIFSGITN